LTVRTLAPGLVDRVLAALPPDADLAVVRDGERTIVGIGPAETVTASGDVAFAHLDALDTGWWAGFCTYDLGRSVERIPALAADDLGLPDVVWTRFETRLTVEADGSATLDGASHATLERALNTPPSPPAPTGLTGWRSSLARATYEDAVEVVLDHIRAGDCYQVNLTRRLVCDRPADPVALYRILARGNPAPHAALLRVPGVSVVSASPERFLRVDSRRVQTRPIKGTGRDPEALSRSSKDRAENVMIVDLARNDLGRVCAYGSVRVTELCAVEPHPGLHHLVSTVRGRLREGVGVGTLLRATFPPASVTGAPKPRVMEIIESLEPVRRGVYCGAVGFVDADRGVADLNVAIRTFTVAGGRTFFGVGGGIVADSRPGAEWEETELKAARLLALASG
jgi:para-aminobenzoate synthetase component 1